MRRIIEVVIVFAYCASAAGQAFEAAAINTRTDGTGDIYTLNPFRFDFSGPRLTYGEPRWADIDRYNISAKASAGASLNRAMARLMMRALLADRFHPKAHAEMKEMPVYTLVVARGGPKFKESPPGAERLLTLESGAKSAVLTVTAGHMAQLAAQFSKGGNVDRPDRKV